MPQKFQNINYETVVVHFISRHKKSIEHLKSIKTGGGGGATSFQSNLFETLVFILRVQATPANISIKFVKLHIFVRKSSQH